MPLRRSSAILLALLVSCLVVPLAQAEKPAKVKVPAVAGKKAPAARSALRTAGLKATVVRRTSASVRPGRAIATTPAAGRRVRRGATVKLLVSTGKPTANAKARPKPRPKAVTYQGGGTIDTVDADGGTLDVAFVAANAPLEVLLAEFDDDSAVLSVAVDDDTDLTVTRTDDQESGDDLSFACIGDEVTVTVVSPTAMSALDEQPATSVKIANGDDTDCDIVTVDEDDLGDDPGTDEDPGADDGGDPGDDDGGR